LIEKDKQDKEKDAGFQSQQQQQQINNIAIHAKNNIAQ